MRKDFKYPYRVISTEREQKLNDDFLFGIGWIIGTILFFPFRILGMFLPKVVFNNMLNSIGLILNVIGVIISLTCIIYIIYTIYTIFNL